MLRVGTDCSGIEAPIQALKKLGIPYEHTFCSDIDKHVIQTIQKNYSPKKIFGDITTRDINDVPDIDLYVAGFPCQPFSTAGEMKGFDDKRGNVFWSCIEVIKEKQPKYFILENVKGLLSHDKENKKDRYGRTWNIIWNELKKLEEPYGYSIVWSILNTRDYGLPQNRERLFIVGTKSSFKWSDKLEMDNIIDYIDNEDTIQTAHTALETTHTTLQTKYDDLRARVIALENV